MWYKKTYYDDAEGCDENLRMIDAFKRFYYNEKKEHPEDVIGLAMFGGRIHYFHTNCHYHWAFFSEHGCKSCSKPSQVPEFVDGDKAFAETLSN